MAKVSMALAELVEKGANDDVVGELLSYVAQRLMDFEIEQRSYSGKAKYDGFCSDQRSQTIETLNARRHCVHPCFHRYRRSGRRDTMLI